MSMASLLKVVINSRVFSDRRAMSFSADGGESFPAAPVWAEGLHETFQGCEGSMVVVGSNGTLLYSGVQGTGTWLSETNKMSMACFHESSPWILAFALFDNALSLHTTQQTVLN